MGVRHAGQLKANKAQHLNIFEETSELAKWTMLTALKHNPDLFDNDMLESLCNTSTVL